MDSSAAGLLGFLMFMQLVFLLVLLAGGLYALFALGRAASGLDRLASAVEEWVSRQDNPAKTDLPPSETQSTLPVSSPLPTDSSMPNVSATQSTPAQNSPSQSTPAAPANRLTETHESIL